MNQAHRTLPDSTRLRITSCLAALFTLTAAATYAQQTSSANKPEAAPAAADKAKAAGQKQLTQDLKKDAPEDAKPAAKPGEDAVQMSLFVVNTEKNQGYQAMNSMSGTRLNSSLEDVATSMSVITKEQLIDFAATDINDIFAMEVNTEGTRTYTANYNDSKADVDAVALNPQTANRVRGLGAANVAIGNFAVSSNVPLDTYNVDAVEISRGPNSSIFGLGETSGTVNLVPSTGNLVKSFTRAGLSVSSYGTIRGNIDINRPIFKNVLALRVIGLAEEKGFVRKPSYDKTRRINLLTTFKPFKATTIRLGYENYSNQYSRPNSNMPREFVTLWKSLGKPSYDGTTNTYSYIDANGATVTGTTNPSTNNGVTAFPNVVYLAGLGSGRVRPSMWIDKGETKWFGPTLWLTTSGSNAATNNHEIVSFGTPLNFGIPAQYVGGVGYTAFKATKDKNFYDYSEINLAALNYAYKDAEYFKAELEHYFIESTTQTLALSVGAFKEKIMNMSHAFLGNGGDGVSAYIYPDVNVKLPDGTPNPYYGAPYITALSPQVYSQPIDTLTLKAQLAYQLDLRKQKGWLRFLGMQKVIGYKESFQKEWAQNSLRYKDQIFYNDYDKFVPGSAAATPNPNWLWLTGPNNNSTIWNARYYVGDTMGSNVAYASTPPAIGNVTYHRWGSNRANPGVNAWYNETVPLGTAYFSQGTQQSKVSTTGYVWQGFFLGDRIVPTYGERQDTLRTRNNIAAPATSKDANGYYTDMNWLWDYTNSPWLVTNKITGATQNSGKTRTKGLVVKVFPWMHLRYNQSNSFKPVDYAINLEGDPLPNPFGITKDYGVRFNLFSNKLVVGISRYETSNKDARISDVSARLNQLDFDTDLNNSNMKVDLQDWLVAQYVNKDSPGRNTATNPLSVDEQAAYEAKANTAMGIDQAFIDMIRNYPQASAQNNQSKGYELELNFNPNRFWTAKVTGAKLETMVTAIAPAYVAHVAARMPLWTTITSPDPAYVPNADGTKLWWTANIADQNGYRLPSQWFTAVVDAPMRLQLALLGKPTPQTRKYKINLMTSYRLAGISSNNILKAMSVGGSYRWEDKGALGFYGAAPDADGIVRAYDERKPIYDKSHSYIDLFAGYEFRMWKNRIKTTVRFNIRNVLEGGRLQPYGANPDGSLYNYRIIDPREFILSANFEL